MGDTVTNTGKWPTDRVRLLIRLRLDMEAQFRNGKSRHLLWPQIYSQLKAADPSMTETLKNVQKKFNNMMLTYKRIKSSSRMYTNHSRWEFFEDFDEILSQFGEMDDGNEQSNVRYVKVEKLDDDDSVSFSSDDCDTPSNYNHVVAYTSEPQIRPTVKHTDQTANNGIKPEKLVVPVPVRENDTKKRKLTQTAECNVLKKAKNSTVEPTDDKSWFREYVMMNERKEQRRHEELLEMERKRLEIETKKMQMLRELVDVVKKFVNK